MAFLRQGVFSILTDFTDVFQVKTWFFKVIFLFSQKCHFVRNHCLYLRYPQKTINQQTTRRRNLQNLCRLMEPAIKTDHFKTPTTHTPSINPVYKASNNGARLKLGKSAETIILMDFSRFSLNFKVKNCDL